MRNFRSRKGKEIKKKKGRERKKKMKSMNDHNNNNNGSNNNWLGFSLSPHMKMEVTSDPHQHHHHHHYNHQGQASSAAAALPSTFYNLNPHLSSSGLCYGVGENGGFHSPLTVMPLKSDGSLCIMEALSRSQTEGLLNLTCTFFMFCF